MPSDSRLTAVLIIGAVITLGLRTLPFALVAVLRRAPVVQHLSLAMPAGVLAILAVFLLRDIDLGEPARGVPQVLGVGLAVGVWLWKRNASLAIVTSTAAYMAVVNLVPGATA